MPLIWLSGAHHWKHSTHALAHTLGRYRDPDTGLWVGRQTLIVKNYVTGWHAPDAGSDLDSGRDGREVARSLPVFSAAFFRPFRWCFECLIVSYALLTSVWDAICSVLGRKPLPAQLTCYQHSLGRCTRAKLAGDVLHRMANPTPLLH